MSSSALAALVMAQTPKRWHATHFRVLLHHRVRASKTSVKKHFEVDTLLAFLPPGQITTGSSVEMTVQNLFSAMCW